MHFFKRQYKDVFLYIQRYIVKPFLFLTVLFPVVCIGAYAVVLHLPHHAIESLLQGLSGVVQSKGLETAEGTLFAVKIFLNNLQATALIWISGAIPFLFLPVFFLTVNAAVVGGTVGISHVLTGEAVGMILLKYILPHGIWEIPALLMAGTLGTVLCLVLFKKLFGEKKEEPFWWHWKKSFKVFLCVILPLLIVAAVIEGVILPKIIV